jgi:hypothetical protein
MEEFFMKKNFNEEFDSNKIYEPIIKQLEYWKDYHKRDAERNVNMSMQGYKTVCSDDEFRAANDRDCILTGGNLNADTIFSLWLPLRHTIAKINSEEKISEIGNINDKKSFVCALLEDDNLEKLLPKELSIVRTLSELFTYGMERENVMLLPKRVFHRGDRVAVFLNRARGCKPYWDYIPHFLYELFEGGDFADAVGNDDEACRTWIREQNMTMLFEDGILDREHIKDLAGSGSVKASLAPAGSSYEEGLVFQEKKLRNYIDILKIRKAEING